MPKRGETRPWRMTYTWTGATPVTATNAFGSRADAEDAARTQASRIGGTSGAKNCIARVTHRDEPKAVLAWFVGDDVSPEDAIAAGMPA